jgi:hypothetical protein
MPECVRKRAKMRRGTLESMLDSDSGPAKTKKSQTFPSLSRPIFQFEGLVPNPGFGRVPNQRNGPLLPNFKAASIGRFGLLRISHPTTIGSACPSRRMRPTAMVMTRSRGAHARPSAPVARPDFLAEDRRDIGDMPPDEQSIIATRSVFRIFARRTLCSGSQPASSSTDRRTNGGLFSGQCTRTASALSMRKRIRFASDPPDCRHRPSRLCECQIHSTETKKRWQPAR